jgi:lactate 2-monooxygenase
MIDWKCLRNMRQAGRVCKRQSLPTDALSIKYSPLHMMFFYWVREVPADKEYQWQILPRVMRPVMPFRNLSTVLFYRTIPAPIMMAPVGVQTLFHPSGKLATTKVFGELGLPFTLSTVSSTGFTDVAQSNGSGNPRWYQLYWPSDDDLTRSYLLTAKKNGYEVLVVTVDTWGLG